MGNNTSSSHEGSETHSSASDRGSGRTSSRISPQASRELHHQPGHQPQRAQTRLDRKHKADGEAPRRQHRHAVSSGADSSHPYQNLSDDMGNASSAEKLPKKPLREGAVAAASDEKLTAPCATATPGRKSSTKRPRPTTDKAQHQQQRSANDAAPQDASTAPQTDSTGPTVLPVRGAAYPALSNLHFPPRMPLPIQAEVYEPASPEVDPADFVNGEARKSKAGLGTSGIVEGEEGLQDEDEDVPVDDDERLMREGGISGLMPTRSLLSHTTADEDEEVEEYGEEGVDEDGTLAAVSGEQPGLNKLKVPTMLEWRGKGDKVYVTGTFAQWSKKYRMHRDPTSNTMKITLDLNPGPHHLRFIVDGAMVLSADLPTAVDWTNTLVNYLEISQGAALPTSPASEDLPTPSAPIPVNQQKQAQSTIVDEAADPAIAAQSGIATHDHQPASQDGTTQSTLTTEKSSTRPYTGPLQPSFQGTAASDQDPDQPRQELMEPRPDVTYAKTVPTYLTDLDHDEKSARYARASSKLQEVPAPPTLPMFMQRSILNMATPMKDDASVLQPPNHTILNHLATSSIRNEVLATSLTVRYRRKYVTLITYRPTTMDD